MATLLATASALAQACPNIVPEPLSDRLKTAPWVFLARIDSVAFRTAPGLDPRGTLLAFDTEGKGPARALRWEGAASSVIALRGAPPRHFRLRFLGSRCNGARFHAGNWYLFAVPDFGREIVVDVTDTSAIREIRELDGASSDRAIGDVAALARKALDPGQTRSLQVLMRMSQPVSGFPDQTD